MQAGMLGNCLCLPWSGFKFSQLEDVTHFPANHPVNIDFSYHEPSCCFVHAVAKRMVFRHRLPSAMPDGSAQVCTVLSNHQPLVTQRFLAENTVQ